MEIITDEEKYKEFMKNPGDIDPNNIKAFREQYLEIQRIEKDNQMIQQQRLALIKERNQLVKEHGQAVVEVGRNIAKQEGDFELYSSPDQGGVSKVVRGIVGAAAMAGPNLVNEGARMMGKKPPFNVPGQAKAPYGYTTDKGENEIEAP